jgi:hypothetical protein
MPSIRSAAASLLVVIPALALAGCVPVSAGPQTSEQRDITAVTTVVLDTSGDITISEGEPSLVIHATEDALKRLTSTVAGDTLTLGNKPGLGLDLGKSSYDITLPGLAAIELNGSGDIKATVSSPGAISLEVDGSGNVDWTGLSAESVEVQLPGSGDIQLTGTTGDLSIELDGSGSVDTQKLDAQTVVVSLDGSGDVHVTANESLEAEISGSGRVVYSGDPSVRSEVSGSGEIVKG